VTLILSMVNPDQAIVVADRRLTSGDRIQKVGGEERGSNKGFLLICDDAKMVVTFTGLAEAGRFITRKWLLEGLVDVRRPDHRIEGISLRLAEEAKTIEKLSIPAEFRRLSIAMAGYVYDGEHPQGTLIHISNFDQMDDSDSGPSARARGAFSVQAVREGRSTHAGNVGAVLAIGADGALEERDWMVLTELVTSGKSAHAIVNKAVHALRSASANTLTVGRECMSLALSPDPQKPAEGHFHPDGKAKIVYQFGSVDLRSNSVGLVADSPERWAEEADGTPVWIEERPRKQARNALCACGSGQKYKKCCGR
jgi:hypothetical protein